MLITLLSSHLIFFEIYATFLGEELRLPVNSQDYLTKLVEYGIMKLHAAATVKETNQTWIEEDDFQVIMPVVDITLVMIIVKGIRGRLLQHSISAITLAIWKCRCPHQPKWDSRWTSLLLSSTA